MGQIETLKQRQHKSTEERKQRFKRFTKSTNQENEKNENEYKEIIEIFDFYKDTESEIQIEGIIKILDDLELEINSLHSLWFIYNLNTIYYTINKENFIKSFLKFNVKNLQEMKNKIPQNPIENEEMKEKLFKFTFQCNVRKGIKRIEKEDSIFILNLFFGNENKKVNEFIEYLNKDEIKPLNRDEWFNLYDFILNINEDFSNYDSSGNSYWPLFFDQYVDYKLKELK